VRSIHQSVTNFDRDALVGSYRQPFSDPAWLLWSLAHIYFLIGFRNRLTVAMNWGWNYLTFQRGTRLITGISGSRIEDVPPAVMTAPPTAAESQRPRGRSRGLHPIWN
jgi:hypothetical protein